MEQTTLRIDDDTYYLPAGVDIDTLRREIVAACEGAPVFVDFTALEGLRVSVLVTPRTSVRFVTATVSDDTLAGDGTSRSDDMEFDLYEMAALS